MPISSRYLIHHGNHDVKYVSLLTDDSATDCHYTSCRWYIFGSKEQQIVAASGSRLSLLRPDAHLGKVTTLVTQDVFGIIGSFTTFRLAGSTKGM
jgi:hypothetical protein